MSETMEMESKPTTARIPRSAEDDYTPDMTEKRRAFIAERSGASLRHTAQYSFDPKLLPAIWSITLPSLIVATYGGGTSLPTQRECLEMLGCYGAGKSKKLAEIIAATVLAGETSLSGAIMASEWVTSHDKYGRNRK